MMGRIPAAFVDAFYNRQIVELRLNLFRLYRDKFLIGEATRHAAARVLATGLSTGLLPVGRAPQ